MIHFLHLLMEHDNLVDVASLPWPHYVENLAEIVVDWALYGVEFSLLKLLGCVLPCINSVPMAPILGSNMRPKIETWSKSKLVNQDDLQVNMQTHSYSHAEHLLNEVTRKKSRSREELLLET